jgi:hypothetical protein
MKQAQAIEILDELFECQETGRTYRTYSPAEAIQAGKFFRQQLRSSVTQMETLVTMTEGWMNGGGSEFDGYSKLLANIGQGANMLITHAEVCHKAFPAMEPAWRDAAKKAQEVIDKVSVMLAA